MVSLTPMYLNKDDQYRVITTVSVIHVIKTGTHEGIHFFTFKIGIKVVFAKEYI